MNDILARLQPPHSSVAALDSDEIEDLCDAAAQEIERLTAERDALRGLLREALDDVHEVAGQQCKAHRIAYYLDFLARIDAAR